MEIAKLVGEPREASGSRAARRVRRGHKVPGVIYGHQQEPEYVAVAKHDLGLLLEHGTHMIDLSVEGKSRSVLMKDVQYDSFGMEPVHVDFMRVELTERVTVAVPLEYRGEAAGTHEGGLFEEDLADVEVETLAGSIPESIRVNIAALKLGDMIHVKDLELPEGVIAMTPPDTIVCAVRAKAAAISEAEEGEEEEGAEGPEIITARDKEGESSED